MPYIKQDLRPKFQETINNVVLTIMRNDLPKIVEIELFGFFVDRLACQYMGGIASVNPLNANSFVPGTRKALEDYATKMMSMINRDDVLQSSGDLNYVVSTIWLGMLGAHPEVDRGNYGFRCLTRAALEQILDELGNVKFVSLQAPESRRRLAVRGVLNDVVSEMYRRQTVPYEDEKISENGDIDFWSQS